MTDAQDPRIGQPVARNVQMDGTWYRPGDVPSAEHAVRITNRRAWGDDMGEFEVPGPSQFATDDDGKVQPPSGQVVQEKPAQAAPSTEEPGTEPAPADGDDKPKRSRK